MVPETGEVEELGGQELLPTKVVKSLKMELALLFIGIGNENFKKRVV